MLKRNSGKRQGIVKTLVWSLLILALPACSGTPADDDAPNPTTPPASGTDADHDGVSVEAGDCDDANPDVNPNADELCDGIDNNCNGEQDGATSIDAITYYYDGDRDAFGNSTQTLVACTAPTGYVTVGDDCNDNDASINPGQPEVCDGKDNNCNGELDGSNSQDASLWYYDGDKDGYGDPSATLTACTAPAGYIATPGDCNDSQAAIHPGVTEICDAKDNDCDGETDETGADGGSTWYADADNDGWGNVSVTLVACSQPSGFVVTPGDCNDQNANVYPYATEFINGQDDDCDGQIDEGTNVADDDGDGYSENQGDCNDGDKTISPNGKETLYGCDGKDQDCDGTADDGLACKDDDGDGYSENQGDCNDNNAALHPGATDSSCDGIDQDCNGVDGSGTCSDVDGDGWSVVAGDCNDFDSTVYPGAQESYDGVDDDCDGFTDEGALPLNALIFTEMLPNPSGEDTQREWFELYNNIGFDIDLFGWKFIDNYTSSPQIYLTVNQHVIIAAGDYAVIGNCSDTSLNGGIVEDYSYYNCVGGALALSNNPSTTTPERLTLYDPAGTQVTMVSWVTSVVDGASLQLPPSKYSFYSALGCEGAVNCYCSSYSLTPGSAGTCP